ncbi:MAG: enoyl-CoA hydratase/isomerase family protein [Deltaproteobacteria bacterium]|nr:enoyl-CoA hydratase/isomerase family protein [Deltaproteobacteria bacterium]
MSEKLKPAVLVPAYRAVNVKQYEQVKITKSHGGRVATISWKTKNKKLNTLTIAITDELRSAVSEVGADESVHIVVFRGEGGNFFVGDDLIEMHEGMWGNPNQVMKRIRYYQDFAQSIEEMDKVTLAVVEGYVLGGGLETAMVCDFVLAGESCQWGFPEVDNAMTPGWGGTTRMIRLIGRRRTKEICMIGALHSAANGVEWGMFNQAVPDAQVDQEVEKFIQMMLVKNQQCLRQLKFVLNKNADADVATALAFEAMNEVITSSNNWRPETPKIPDAEPGVGLRAFAEKNEVWNRRRELALNFWSK